MELLGEETKKFGIAQLELEDNCRQMSEAITSICFLPIALQSLFFLVCLLIQLNFSLQTSPQSWTA